MLRLGRQQGMGISGHRRAIRLLHPRGSGHHDALRRRQGLQPRILRLAGSGHVLIRQLLLRGHLLPPGTRSLANDRHRGRLARVSSLVLLTEISKEEKVGTLRPLQLGGVALLLCAPQGLWVVLIILHHLRLVRILGVHGLLFVMSLLHLRHGTPLIASGLGHLGHLLAVWVCKLPILTEFAKKEHVRRLGAAGGVRVFLGSWPLHLPVLALLATAHFWLRGGGCSRLLGSGHHLRHHVMRNLRDHHRRVVAHGSIHGRHQHLLHLLHGRLTLHRGKAGRQPA
mmetsp:Transcript_3398/g.8619  ORF Transcript_3398/g.8619 Transcript_3398/m.8619 type:complete len:283 (+) Transcript_3398:124-972(+)